jgi:hypothetical protein
MMRLAGSIPAIAIAASISTGTAGQAEQPAPAPVSPSAPMQLLPDGKVMRRQIYDALAGTNITIELDETPAREAFDRLRRMLPVPLVGRYRDDALGFGIDPEVPITLKADDRPAIEVLEGMIEQCGQHGAPCTWQIRLGFIEFGTKGRLSVPAARETRLYYIADLIVDIPEDVDLRTRREFHALGIVQTICETIEPGQWDYGQAPDPQDEEFYRAGPERSPGARAAPVPAAPDLTEPQPGTSPPTKPEAQRPEPPPRRYVAPSRIAIIRYWRDVMIVHAPDYIHRQIDGYPKPVPADVQR